MDIFEINERNRNIDATDDLIPISELKKKVYDFQYPTIIPQIWSEYEEMTQETYTYEFKRKHDIPYEVLKSTTNIVVAGGAAARPLYVSKINFYTDIDIFIYGIYDESVFWEKVNEVANKLIYLTVSKYKTCSVTQKMKKGIIIIGISNEEKQLIIEYQIILRMYHTLSSIIHAFDIPSCCIAFNGSIAYTTTLGKFAYENQVNLVFTKYRSTSFEKRLVKYFGRGFGMAFIGYDLNKAIDDGFVKNDLLVPCHKYLHMEVLRKENKLTGIVYPKNMAVSHLDEEYHSIKNICHSYDELVTQVQCIEDFGLTLSQQNKPIDYTLFHTMDVEEILNKFPNTVTTVIDKHCHKIMNTKLNDLTSIRLPKNVLKTIIDILITDTRRYSVEKIYKLLREQIDVHSRYIPEWIIIQDPQRQYTAAINPIIEHPEDWYGPGYYKK